MITPNKPIMKDQLTISMTKLFRAALLALALCLTTTHASESAFMEDFESIQPGSVPDDFLVVDGDFEVSKQEDNHVLLLPGSPLETFTVLFGPTLKENIFAKARIRGTSHGRRYPSFGVGLNSISGFQLRVTPSKRALELYKGDVPVESVPYRWESDQWTNLHLEVRKLGEDKWQVRGKAWAEGEDEPDSWTIATEQSATLYEGRSTIVGIPYAGTAIHFDDLATGKLD